MELLSRTYVHPFDILKLHLRFCFYVFTYSVVSCHLQFGRWVCHSRHGNFERVPSSSPFDWNKPFEMIIIIKVEMRKILKETPERFSWESQHVPCARPFGAVVHRDYGWKSVYQIEFDGTLERFLGGVSDAGKHFCSICRPFGVCLCARTMCPPFNLLFSSTFGCIRARPTNFQSLWTR